LSFETIDPRQAHELMSGDEPHVYLDVRSVEEFAAGHAPGALNIPIAHKGAMGMAPNEDFLRVAKAHLSADQKVVVGCKMGGRSTRACEMLAAEGYTNLKNIDGGYGGNPNGDSDAIRSGWAACGLPTTEDPGAGAYDSLAG